MERQEVRDMPDGAAETFDRTLVRLRRAAGLTQEQLAQRCGLSTRGVGNLERGQRHPRRVTVQLLADGLALPEDSRAELLAAARRGRPQPPDHPVPPPRPAPDLIGRTEEHALLDKHISGTGRPFLVFAGQTGIGKTRLLAEAATLAEARGTVVLSTACSRYGGEPYAPLSEAFARHVSEHPAGPGLAFLLPEQRTAEPAPARWLMFAEAARFLDTLARRRGVLVILDDLQWAGPDGLALLASLVQDVRPDRVRFLAAYRDTEIAAAEPLADTLLDLYRKGLVTQHSLAPLADEDATMLLHHSAGTEVGQSARDRVLRLAGGLPLFLVQLGHVLGRSGKPPAELPWGLAHAVRRQVGSLPERTAEVLTLLAVGQQRMDPDVLAAAAGLDPAELSEVLAPAHTARLLDENAEGVRLTHELVAEVVNGDLPPSRRHALHRRLAEALGGAAAAYHYTHAQDTERAAQTLRHAAEKASRQAAHDTAAQHLGALVDLLDRTGSQAAVAEAAEAWADALAAAGRYDAALAAAERALLVYRKEGDEERQRLVIARIGYLHYQRGTPREGLARIAPTLTEDRPGGSSVQLRLARAANLYQSTRYRESVEVSTSAIGAAESVGDEHGLAGGHLRRGLALRLLGRNEEALADLHTAAATAELCGDRDIVIRALTGVAVLHHYRGELVRADRQFERILRLAEELGDRELLSRAVCNVGASAVYVGRWGDALRRFSQALELAGHGRSPMCGAMALIGRGALWSACGRYDVASDDLTQVIRLGQESDNADIICNASAQLAENDVRAGRPERGVRRLLPLLALQGERSWQMTDALPFLAEAQLAAGDPVAAGETAAEAVACTEHIEHILARTDAFRVQGLAFLRRGDFSAAGESLEEAGALAARVDSPYLHARVSAAHADLSDRRGDCVAATRDRERAEELFTALRQDALAED